MILEISPPDIVAYCRATLGIPGDGGDVDEVLLSGLLRRCAGVLCPCSRTALRAALMESLAHLNSDENGLSDRLEKLVDDLIVSGDLLELSDVTTDDPDVRGTWVFSAPPSFIVRSSGSVFLTGIVPDQDTFLPGFLNDRIVYSRNTRHVLPEPDEDLAETLSAQGLNHLHEATWLRAPKTQPPKQLLEKYKQQLAEQQNCGSINGLDILDPTQKVTYYRGRWTEPAKQTGIFIARRPQEFGAPIWCFAELIEGAPQRLLDLPPTRYRWRACDAAWHLQMAIDHCCGQPQQYRRFDTENGSRFDFYSPLPLWAQRRLMIFGDERARERSLLAYEIGSGEADQEEQYLRENLWLVPSQVDEIGGGK